METVGRSVGFQRPGTYLPTDQHRRRSRLTWDGLEGGSAGTTLAQSYGAFSLLLQPIVSNTGRPVNHRNANIFAHLYIPPYGGEVRLS